MAREPLRGNDPARIGRYRLTGRLGTGGMGVVYLGLAEDDSLVAVKVLRPDLADDPEFRARFGREVAALMQVRGPHTVRMIEADTCSPRPFMVTEYAAGPSLAEHVDLYGPLADDALHGLATGLAEALTTIHAAGVVHRDLKPSNVILGDGGPRVIDFGIAHDLDATALTKVGMMVGSVGFIAPEQVTGRAGQPADIFAWAVTVAYAATGQLPFGAGPSDAIMYRVLHAEPDITAVPGWLRSLVASALAKDPRQRPAASELVGRLPSARADIGHAARVPPQPSPTPDWPATQPSSLLLEPAGSARPGAGGGARRTARRRAALTGGLPVALAVLAAVTLAVVTGHGPDFGRLTSWQADQDATAVSMGTYPGLRKRGVFGTIGRVVASGRTIVAAGSQTSDGLVRQQFFVSADGGATWRLAPVHGPGGGQPALGHPAVLLAGGPGGWVAVGSQATWTSPDGLSWTLAATHGITPRLPGDRVLVITRTAQGFLAAGENEAAGRPEQAVLWTSRDGIAWRRSTAAQLGLAEPGETVTDIAYATAHGDVTLISGGVDDGQTASAATWLSTDGGSTWTQVAIPVDHGAGTAISGLAFDGSGFVAVRPGLALPGSDDGVSYFSPNGRVWAYAGTIGTTGGWSPAVVKGSQNGLVAVGSTAGGQIVAYTSTGGGANWRSAATLGDAAAESVTGATVAPAGTVIAVGSSASGQGGQQPFFVEADTAGRVRPVSVAGATVPELAVNALAVDGAEQIAVGSADGYPAVWRQAGGGSGESWTLVSAPPASPEFTALTGVTHGSAGWLAVGADLALTSADGTTWRHAPAAPDLTGSTATAAGPAGYLIAGNSSEPGDECLADAWWSRDLTSWTPARAVNGGRGSCRVLALAASGRGFVAVGSRGRQPAVWLTADGRSWTTTVLPRPAGAVSAVLQQVAVSGNRMVAMGRERTGTGAALFAELSTDAGARWRQVPLGLSGPGAEVTALTAGSSGFAAAVRSGGPGRPQVVLWTSADGTSWTASHVGGLDQGGTDTVTALAPSGSAIVGLAVVATQQSQQPVVLTLP